MGKRLWPIMMAIALAWTGRAEADLLLYSVQADVSGTLNGVAFTDALLTISAVGDPSATLYDPSDSEYHTLATSTSVTIAGLGTVSFTDKIDVVDDQATGVFRIYDLTVNKSVLGVSDSYFSANGNGYDLQSAFGPITDTQTHDFGIPYGTTGGDLVLTANAKGNQATASASVTPTAVPEPGPFLLTGLSGLFALGFFGARRRRGRS